MKNVKHLIGAAFFILLLQGCGLHAPVSESMIFYDISDETKDFRSIHKNSHRRASTSVTFIPGQVSGKAAGNSMKDPGFNDVMQFNFSGMSYLFQPAESFAVAINPSIFINAGTDFTWYAGNNFYLTGAANVQGYAEGVIQYKFLNHRNYRATAGLAYRREKVWLGSFWQHSGDSGDSFYLNFYGVRGIINFDFFKRDFRIIAGAYYNPEYEAPVFNIGAAFVLTRDGLW